VSAAGAARFHRGLLDTSVVIDLDRIPVEELPVEAAISAITLAELAAGPHAAADSRERALRQQLLQRIEAAHDPVAFDAAAARAYGLIFAAASAAGRTSRRRAVDLLIAATAAAAGLPLFTRNPDDLSGLDGIVEVVPV
jgi:predicted nucleic acid-binding protein